MPPRIKLESITLDSSNEILQLDQGLITLGREPENNIVIDSATVSRRHASIFSSEEHWLLKDFESSNGTWINGTKITPGAIKLLRHTDIVTLSDFSFRLSEVEPREESFWRGFPPSLLVFYKEQYDSEFPLAAPGSSFQLGGVDGDFFVEGANPEAVFFKIVFSGQSLEVQAPNVEQKVSVNGTLISGIVSITDRDELLVPPYRIVVNYPATAQTASGMRHQAELSHKQIHAYEQENVDQTVLDDGWVSEAARRKASLGQKFLFGASEGSAMERTQAVPQVQPEDFRPRTSSSGSGYEMSASQKFSAAYMDDPDEGRGMGDTFLVVFGAVISILVLVLVVYFVTTMM